jgi:hypothetical protein
VTHLGHELDPSAIAVPHVAQKDIGSLPKTCRTEVIRITRTRQSEMEAASAFSLVPGGGSSCPGRGGRPPTNPRLQQESKGDRDVLRALIGSRKPTSCDFSLRFSMLGKGRKHNRASATRGYRDPRLRCANNCDPVARIRFFFLYFG